MSIWMLDHSDPEESNCKIQKVLNLNFRPSDESFNRLDDEGRSLKNRMDNSYHISHDEKYRKNWTIETQEKIDILWSKILQGHEFNTNKNQIVRLFNHYKITAHVYNKDEKPFLEEHGITAKWREPDIQALSIKRYGGKNTRSDTIFNRVFLNENDRKDKTKNYQQRHTAGSDAFAQTIVFSKLKKWRDEKEKTRIAAEGKKDSKEKRVKVAKKIWKRVWSDFTSVGITRQVMCDKHGYNYNTSMSNESSIPESAYIPLLKDYQKYFPDKDIPFAYFERKNVAPRHGKRYIVDKENLSEGFYLLKKEKGITKKDVKNEIGNFIDRILYYENLRLHEDDLKKLSSYFFYHLPNFKLEIDEYIKKPTTQEKLLVDFFEKIDSKLKAYMLGHLYADGYVKSDPMKGFPNSVNKTVTLSHSLDEEVLIDAFIKAIHGNPESKKILNGKNQIIFKFGSRRFVTDLENKGCYQNKSLTLRFPNEIFKNREHALTFLLGFYDGDGTKNTNYISSGSEKFLEGICTYFEISKDEIKSDEHDKKVGNEKTLTKTFKLPLGNDLWGEMMELAENVDGIPGIKEFPKKRLWDPYIPYKSDPSHTRSLETMKKHTVEILDILRHPDSYTSLSKILHAYGKAFDTALDELVDEKKIIKNVTRVKTEKGWKEYITYQLYEYSSKEKIQKEINLEEIKGNLYNRTNQLNSLIHREKNTQVAVLSQIQIDTKTSQVKKSNITALQEYNTIRAKKAGKISVEKRKTKEHKENMENFRKLSDEALIERIWNDKCVKLIAREFNISDRTVAKICYERLIPTPPSGYFNLSVKEQEEIRSGFFQMIDCLRMVSDQFIPESRIASLSNVKIEFIEKWIDKTPLRFIISSYDVGNYRLNERRISQDSLIRNEILHALLLMDESKSITFLIKNGLINRKPKTIKPILKDLVEQGIVEEGGTKSRPLYKIMRTDLEPNFS